MKTLVEVAHIDSISSAASRVEIAAAEDALADALGWRQRRSELGRTREAQPALGILLAVVRCHVVRLRRILRVYEQSVPDAAMRRRRVDGHRARAVVDDAGSLLLRRRDRRHAGRSASLVCTRDVGCFALRRGFHCYF